MTTSKTPATPPAGGAKPAPKKGRKEDEKPQGVDETDAFLAEIEEDLRAERLHAFLDRYGTHIAVVVVLVIAIVAGYQYWQASLQETRQQQANAYEQAVDALIDNDLQAALAGFRQVTATSPEGYGLFARFSQAYVEFERGEAADGLGVLEGIATDSAVPTHYRDLATLLYVQRAMDAEETDLADLKARLQPLNNPGNQFSPFAAELTAALALQDGDVAAAVRQFQALADDASAPAGVRDRARRVSEALTARQLRMGRLPASEPPVTDPASDAETDNGEGTTP